MKPGATSLTPTVELKVEGERYGPICMMQKRRVGTPSGLGGGKKAKHGKKDGEKEEGAKAAADDENNAGVEAVEEEEEEEETSDEVTSEEDEEDEEDVEEEEIDPDDEDGEKFGEVQVDFEFFDPAEIDFHGLKALLQNYLDGRAYRSSELVETIMQQNTVGSVVKAGEGEDPIAVITVLSLKRYAKLECMGEILEYIRSRCPTDEAQAKLQQAVDAPGTALLLSERLLNCPPEIAPPLLQGLGMEIQWAQEDEPTEELREAFKLERFLVFTRIFMQPEPSGRVQQTASKNAQGGSKVYFKPEDEFLHQHSEWSFQYRQQVREEEADDGLHPHRLVMLVNADALPKVQQCLDEKFGNPAQQKQS